MSKIALISGITGQDGAYLAELLLSKGYSKVVGITRNLHSTSLERLKFLGIADLVEIVQCDLTDRKAVFDLLEEQKPEEIYNLAAQSSVGYSFQVPQETFGFNTNSVINMLEGIRQIDKNMRFYQASSSEMFGNVNFKSLPIRESLLFHPVSPYGISKASAHWLAVNYREAYGLFSACGILFNHESALRGEKFVIKKLINTALKIQAGEEETLTLGNLAISRDWGYAPKYVEAMWKTLQKERADDYIICSGNLSTLQELVLMVFDQVGLDLQRHLRLDQAFMRSLDLGLIYGDNTKAKKQLDWDYELSTEELVAKLITDEKKWLNWKQQ